MSVLAQPSATEQTDDSHFGAAASQASSKRPRLVNADPARQATTLTQSPPSWLHELFYWLQGPDGLPSADGDMLRRLAESIAQLPHATPRPHVGIGDDGSISMEWDFGPVHIGMQVDPDRSYDTVFVDLDGDESVTEAPLTDAIVYVSQLFSRLADSTSRV